MKANANSLLARIYGVYSIQREEMAKVHLLTMGNSRNVSDCYIKYCFDLKGSTKNRTKSELGKNSYTL